MKSIFSFLVLSFFQITTVIAQPVLRIDEKRLERLDAYVQNMVKQGEVNGVTTIILHKGKTVYHKSFGMADIDKNLPMRNDNIYRIASMTKPIVSTALMILFEEGKFLLDDPVSRYIPEFANATVLTKFNEADSSYTTTPAKTAITVRHLLTHTSGIGYAQIGSAASNAIYFKNKINGGIGTPYATLKSVIPRLATLPLLHEPGEKYTYGLNTDVIGYLVEVLSGMPLDEFLRTRLFSPLGMNDTYFFLPKEKQNRLVQWFMQDDKGKLMVQKAEFPLNGLVIRDFPLAEKGSYFSGGAGLNSTAQDYARFGQMLLNGGSLDGKQILSPLTIKAMTSNQIADIPMWNATKQDQQFGLGFGVESQHASNSFLLGKGSYGWSGMYGSHFWADPVNDLVVVSMRNIWPTRNWDYGNRIKPLIYQALVYDK